jgi:proteasome accessory factor C
MTGPQRRKAAETAASQLKRLLHLIPELSDDREHPIADVARLAGTTPKAILADLNALVERYDVPAGWIDGVSIFVDGNSVSVRSNHFRRPMRLTMPELCALELGLMVAAREVPAGDREVIDGALARLRAAIARLPANDRHENLRAVSVPDPESAETLATVRSALRESRKLRIAYRPGAAGEAGERIVCPYGVAFASGAWYLIAYCDRSEGLRFFRLDRMERAEALDQGFARPENFSIGEALPEGRAFAAPDAGTMTVRYSPRVARWIAEREEKPVAADGSLTLEHPVADEEWAMRHVLQYGADAEVLGPPGLRAAVAARLDAMAGR